MDPIGQDGLNDAVRLGQTLREWALESDGVNGIKFGLHEFGTLVQPLQERGAVFAQKRGGKFNRFRFSNRVQIDDVNSTGPGCS